MPNPEVTQTSVFDMQVCVPSEFTDDQVKAFADAQNPAGSELGWTIRKEGHERNTGDPERVHCRDRAGCVHIMLEC